MKKSIQAIVVTTAFCAILSGCKKNENAKTDGSVPAKAIGEVYLKQGDDYVKLSDATTKFCEKYIQPVHPKNWDWGKRDFEKSENKPDTAEARAMRDFVIQNMEVSKNSQIDLSKIKNKEAIKAFLDPKSQYENFNMGEFADALSVELEHGRIKDANVTNNHPLLTSAIVLAHLSETITYYRRLKILEKEAKIYELNRKYGNDKKNPDYLKTLEMLNKDLATAKEDLAKRLTYMKDVPTMEDAKKID